jgi:MFS family permease
MLLYAISIFLSAFLLFQVQPMIARIILPWFGGSAAVWTTCMLFFQVALLVGYSYAHFVAKRLSAKKQVVLHATLLGLSILLMPIAPSAGWKPSNAEMPTLRILALLVVSVGLPYTLLSTTGPLLQAWYARSRPGAMPYRLFALSNLGSMLGLLTYPPLVEPFLSTRSQTLAWSAAYVVFAGLCATTAFKSWKKTEAIVAPEAGDIEEGAMQTDPAPAAGTRIAWILLPACASALLLSVTTHVTQDVAAIPFLWVLPLSLYLLSFILCFDADGWYRRGFFMPLLAASLGGMTYMLWSDRAEIKLWLAVLIWAAGLFVACMVCHGELARIKPHPRYLTSFYLMVSVGGALGGVFVSLFAPAVFNGSYELPISIAGTAVLALLVLRRDPDSRFCSGKRRQLWWVLLAAALGLCFALSYEVRETVSGYRVLARNFYGTLRVSDYGTASDLDGERKLTHGVTNHGEQWLHPSMRRKPTGYYCEVSGVVRGLMASHREGPQKVGVIGLGAGVLSVYARPGDEYRFYELNPLVKELAYKEFSLLRESPAPVEVILGDARLSLEREPGQQYDLLAVDAFSSDSIPVHLLTREAFAVYVRHIKPSGVLCVHVSNRYLNLVPVVQLAAQSLGKDAVMLETEEDEDTGCYATTWVLVSMSKGFFEQPSFHAVGSRPAIPKGMRVWTDDYSNLFRVLD